MGRRKLNVTKSQIRDFLFDADREKTWPDSDPPIHVLRDELLAAIIMAKQVSRIKIADSREYIS